MRPKPIRLVTLGTLIVLAFVLAGATGLTSPAAAQSPRPQFMGLNAYWGELHQHTGYSTDACGTPLQAISRAREKGNDFLAITEHDFGFGSADIGCNRAPCSAMGCPANPAVTDPDKWNTLGKLAQQYTQEGTFVVLRGFEYTRETGHINVFNSSAVYSPMQLDDLYAWLAAQPPEVFAQMNHVLPLDWGGLGDLEGLTYYPPAAARIPLFENAYNERDQYYLMLPRALGQEWQVSSVGYGDGHYADQAGQRHSGIFAPALTAAGVNQALQSGRTFGNTDGSLCAALVATTPQGEQVWMGSATSADALTLSAYAADKTGDAIARMELMGKDGVIASYVPASSPATHTFAVANVSPGDFFYLHVVDANGSHAWSGTISRPLYPRLQSSPAVLDYSFADAAATPVTRTLVLRANDGRDAAWQAEALVPWLAVSPAAGDHLPATVTVTAWGPAAGAVTGAIRFTAAGDYAPLTVTAQAAINGASLPTLGAAPRQQSLTTTLEDPTIGGALSVSTGGSDLAWHAQSSTPWLVLASESGQGDGALAFSVDLTGYASGRYTGYVTLLAGKQIRVCAVTVELRPWQARAATLQGSSVLRDTYLYVYSPATPLGSRGDLAVDNAGGRVPLLRFDLGSLPAGAQVYTATLQLYVRERTVNHSMQLQAYDVRRAWSEPGATWQVTGLGSPWAAVGASAFGVDIAAWPTDIEMANAAGAWMSFDVSALARRWAAQPGTNNGVAIRGSSDVSMSVIFHSAQMQSYLGPLSPRLLLVYGDPPSDAPTATPEPTATATPTPEATPTATPTAVPTSTPTSSATPSPTPTATPKPSWRLFMPRVNGWEL